MTETPSPSQTTFYRLARPVMARFVGVGMIALAIAVFVTTVVVSATEGDLGWIVGVAAVGLAGLLTLGWWLRSRAYVVRCSAQGYSVRFVRGAGVREARWADVESAVTTSPRGHPCLVLKLKDGGATTIPVSILEIDREQFVREMQRHLGRSQRPLGKKRP